MKIQTLISLSLTLMMLVACGPQTQMPNTATGNPSQNAANSPASAAPVASTQSSLQADMLVEHEDEATYADTLTVAQTDAGFSTQQLRVGAGAAAVIKTPRAGVRVVTGSDLRAAKSRAVDMLTVSPAERARLKARLKTAGAVTANADGTLTVDAAAFRAQAKAAMQNRNARLKQQILKLDARLALKKELAQDKIQQLRRQNVVVRTSDKVTETNADGSVTTTLKVSFENKRTALTRESVLVETTREGELISRDYQMTETAKNHTRTSSRVTTFEADGSKNVLIESRTEWKNGRIRESNQERLIDADGAGTGTGTITVTSAEGETKTYTFTLKMDASGTLTSSASDPADSTEVVIDEAADGTATVIVETDGAETAESVDLEAEAEAAAEA
ncbi:MAG: hypothetical protein ACO1RX_09780 [Candidatus Sericytochromatia bacterium]